MMRAQLIPGTTHFIPVFSPVVNLLSSLRVYLLLPVVQGGTCGMDTDKGLV